MLRISVTDLDSYLYWRDNEEMDFEALLRRLRRREPQTDPMLRGIAFHSIMDRATEGSWDTASADGYQFTFAVETEIAVPPIRELKAECVLNTPSGPVTLVGKVDALDGLTVHDYKLTERFDAEKYFESYQWRAYLMMFGAERFVYDVFVCRPDDPKIIVYDYQRLPVCAYPEMRADVERVVAELAEIVAKYVPSMRMEA